MSKAYTFPAGFLWGAATAAHQVEGDNRASDWWQYEERGRLPHRSGDACRHYRLFERDFDLAKRLGHNAHRFSIEWSRVEPVQGSWNADALDHYRDVVRALVEMITNASDSYSRLERRGAHVDGVIEVAAERLRSGEYNRVAVRDHAEGMRRQDLDERILQVGARTSERGDRGVQGRGAKDIAFFGKARYESIKDGHYAQVTSLSGWQPPATTSNSDCRRAAAARK